MPVSQPTSQIVSACIRMRDMETAMIAQLPARVVTPRSSVERLINHYGAMPVLWATIRVLLTPRKRQPRPPDSAYLSPHLRRDIGLPPITSTMPKYYELR